MITDPENPADRVYLDGKRLDLTITTMADDERGVVEQFVIEQDDSGRRRVATGLCGQPKMIELRGDVRIIMPPTWRRSH